MVNKIPAQVPLTLTIAPNSVLVHSDELWAERRFSSSDAKTEYTLTVLGSCLIEIGDSDLCDCVPFVSESLSDIPLPQAKVHRWRVWTQEGLHRLVVFSAS